MTQTVAITADSAAGRVLLALRAGPHTPGELDGRLGCSAPQVGLPQLIRGGLVERQNDGGEITYRITEAGRAACPFRNPKAALPATPPEVFIMPKGETKLTRQKVLDAIVNAGPAGLDRKQLAAKFDYLAAINAIDNHINKLTMEQPPVVFKPRPGLLVDIKYKSTYAPEIAPETASTATDDWIPEPLATDPAPAAYAVETLDVEQITARPVVFDTELEYPCQVEFCVFSSGGLDMLTDAGTISLSAPVLRKLRAFLGLFAEAA